MGFSHYINKLIDKKELMDSYYGGKNKSELHPQLASTASIKLLFITNSLYSEDDRIIRAHHPPSRVGMVYQE